MLINSNQVIIAHQYQLFMQGDFTQQQFDKILRLCDVLGLQDFQIGAAMLKQNDWSLQKAIGIEEESVPSQNNTAAVQPSNNPSMVNQNFDEPMQYDQFYNEDQANLFEYDYMAYQEQFQKNKKIEENIKNFNQGYVSIPLTKTKSQIKQTLQGKLGISNYVTQNYSKLRSEHQHQLLQKSGILFQRILHSKSAQLQRCYTSIQRNETNKQFVSYLYKKYQSPINFTFGTFLLNLARSCLDHKYLLVYIHRSQFQQNKSIKMLLKQKQIAYFINKHCVVYGMFDNSDDYQILHEYVQMKQLPAFVLFKFDRQKVKQKFVGLYPMLQHDPQNFIQWVASKIGVVIKKKQKKPQSTITQKSHIQMSNIIYEQNFEYEQMARLYQMKRAKSQLRKQSIEFYEQQIEKMRQKFKQQPQFEAGKTIQIRFRLPMSGNSSMRTFKLDQKIQIMFDYINCFGRQQFEQKLAKFDLTQTFPKISLSQKRQLLIRDVFPDSQRQNIIVQQL